MFTQHCKWIFFFFISPRAALYWQHRNFLSHGNLKGNSLFPLPAKYGNRKNSIPTYISETCWYITIFSRRIEEYLSSARLTLHINAKKKKKDIEYISHELLHEKYPPKNRRCSTIWNLRLFLILHVNIADGPLKHGIYWVEFWSSIL